MKTIQLISVALPIALLTGVVGCAPKKDKEPPKPQVTANTTPADAPAGPKPQVTAKAKAADAPALPKLGAAPTWQLQDINGKTVSSEDFKGKVVVVDFWATWCGPCRYEIPGYVEMMKKYGGEGLVIVGVSIDQGGPGVVKSFAEKMQINYPLVMADENVAAAFGGIEVVPTTFLIDREGQVRHRKEGAEEAADYEKKVLAVLRG